MESTIEQQVTDKLAVKLVSAELASAQWQAYFENEVEKYRKVKQQLEFIDSVLSSEPGLLDLFNEASAKLNKRGEE
nr:MAG TPA: hypothetical protein [Caudoviricetes sp.]